MEKNRSLDYLKLLSSTFPTIADAAEEIVNLNAILNLPKGTEHFISDVHGEYEAFSHVLRNCSGSLRRKIDQQFSNTLTEKEKRTLATLIYYPKRKLARVLKSVENKEEWYRITLFRLINVCRLLASKYTRSKVRKSMPRQFSYIIEELLHEQEGLDNKQEYYTSIIETLITTGRAGDFIIAISDLIKRLAVDKLHIIGDIYDRGPGAHKIMDTLIEYHSVDIQWGNHDVLWMGAAAGEPACIANVLRNSLRYGNVMTLENGYGISMMPLASFAMDVYRDDPCTSFLVKNIDNRTSYTAEELSLIAKMHKAITVIQLKLEGQIIKRRPEFDMNDRLLLDKIDIRKGIIKLDGREYELNDNHFPTLNPDSPYELTDKEQGVLEQLLFSFKNSRKLQEHIRFLYSNGSLYLCSNGNLLYHGCIAIDENGDFISFTLGSRTLSGKAFLDHIDSLVRKAYFSEEETEEKLEGKDMIWYLWSGANSPLFGKDKMATFERYFINDAETHKEVKDPYYHFRDSEEVCRKILKEFSLDEEHGHIINGHVPVKVKKGESPVKAGGKLFVIDGGFAKAYQSQTGIAGYTLVYNSHGIMLCAHDPFESVENAIKNEVDIHSDNKFVEKFPDRLRVRDTDRGRELQVKINDLYQLLQAYRSGTIKEKILFV